MTAFKDLTGQRFGRLLVIERYNFSSDGKTRFLCKCDCGNNNFVVLSYSLIVGDTKSCGCYRSKKTSERKSKEHEKIGKRFGRLTVIKRVENSSRGHISFLCKCDCSEDSFVVVESNNLVNFHTRSCGCLSKESASQRFSKEKEMIGKKFGRWNVVERGENNEQKQIQYLCFCDCSPNIFYLINGNTLRNGESLSCGCYKKQRTSEVSSKENEMIGNTFGLLTVLSKKGLNHDGNITYMCRCSCGSEPIEVPGNRLRSGNKKSCGCLKDGAESYVAIELKKYCKDVYNSISEYGVFKNPKTGYILPFDIYIAQYNIYVEIMGSQHYAFKSRFHIDTKDFEYQQYKDSIKKQYAEENGYYLEIDLRKIKTVEQAIEYLESYLDNFRLQENRNDY